ncbi:MAG: patatin-like phospholipase family protein [Desulfobacterales bacterium]
MRALVLEGGGMRAGFVAGALMALMDLGFLNFDIAVAVSASVPTLAYFLAGQRRAIEKIWRHELTSEKLVAFRYLPLVALSEASRYPVLDTGYLVDHIIARQYPLDRDALKRCPTKFLMAATRVPSGKLNLLRPGQEDIYRIFKACLAVPACTKGPVRVGKRKYLDGGIANPLPVWPLLKYRDIRILSILSKPPYEGHYPTNLLERVLFWRYFRKHAWVTRCLKKSTHVYAEQVALLEEYGRLHPPAALIIRPEKMPAADFVTRNGDKVNLTIDAGYRRVETLHEKLATFLAPERAAFGLPAVKVSRPFVNVGSKDREGRRRVSIETKAPAENLS